MDSTRRTSFITGVLFIITFVTSIPAAFLLYAPVLDDASYVVGAGADGGVALGAFLEVLLIVANVGTAVALFPILKRQSEPLALGYVTARLVESTFIAIGIVSLLAVVTLRQDAAGGDPSSLVTAGQSLVAVHDWTFLLGPNWVVGVGNGLILGFMMYRTGLVPRRFAVLGLVGGSFLVATGSAAVLDCDGRRTAATLLLSENVHPRVVMELLGHSQMRTTMDIYSHVMPALGRDAADRMGNALWG